MLQWQPAAKCLVAGCNCSTAAGIARLPEISISGVRVRVHSFEDWGVKRINELVQRLFTNYCRHLANTKRKEAKTNAVLVVFREFLTKKRTLWIKLLQKYLRNVKRCGCIIIYRRLQHATNTRYTKSDNVISVLVVSP